MLFVLILLKVLGKVWVRQERFHVSDALAIVVFLIFLLYDFPPAYIFPDI